MLSTDESRLRIRGTFIDRIPEAPEELSLRRRHSAPAISSTSSEGTSDLRRDDSHYFGSLMGGASILWLPSPKPSEFTRSITLASCYSETTCSDADADFFSCTSKDQSFSHLAAASSADYEACVQRGATTVILSNVPYRCDINDVIATLHLLGFENTYNMVYIPYKCPGKRIVNKAYFFINFRATEHAAAFIAVADQATFSSSRSMKICVAAPAQCQGLLPNLWLHRRQRLGCLMIFHDDQPLRFDFSIPSTLNRLRSYIECLSVDSTTR